MTDDQLDMHKRLQPLYKRVMGSWLQGDNFVSFPELDDILTCDEAYLGHPVSRNGFRYPKAIFIPLTIDSENPERGLWGMLSKENWMKMCVKVLDTGVFSYMLPREGRMDWCIDNPTTAILKVLCEQEGV
jgi:hypothetical protein